MENTEANLEVVFNEPTLNESIPSAMEIAETLKTANASTGGLQFDRNTINVTSMFSFSIFHAYIKIEL